MGRNPPPQKEQYQAPTLHYHASGAERKRLYNHSGRVAGPACNTGDGHWKAAPVNAMVGCPKCLVAMQRLHIELNEFQKTILGGAGIKV